MTITPCGNYEKASKFTVAFKIVQKELTEENVTIKYAPLMNVKKDKKGNLVGQTQKVTLKVRFTQCSCKRVCRDL